MNCGKSHPQDQCHEAQDLIIGFDNVESLVILNISSGTDSLNVMDSVEDERREVVIVSMH